MLDMTSSVFKVTSSCGQLVVFRNSGKVFSYQQYEKVIPGYLDEIVKIDIAEYKKRWGVKVMPNSVDILNVGYWDKAGIYEEPAESWRQELVLLKKGKL